MKRKNRRPYATFCKPGIPDKIAQLRYTYQVGRVQGTLEKLYSLRKELSIPYVHTEYIVQQAAQRKGSAVPATEPSKSLYFPLSASFAIEDPQSRFRNVDCVR